MKCYTFHCNIISIVFVFVETFFNPVLFMVYHRQTFMAETMLMAFDNSALLLFRTSGLWIVNCAANDN